MDEVSGFIVLETKHSIQIGTRGLVTWVNRVGCRLMD